MTNENKEPFLYWDLPYLIRKTLKEIKGKVRKQTDFAYMKKHPDDEERKKDTDELQKLKLQLCPYLSNWAQFTNNRNCENRQNIHR